MEPAYMEMLNALARIRDVCQGQLALPQLCVVGDQSSGKSSLLQCITGVEFPVKSGICTRVPTVVECRRAVSESCEIRAGNGEFSSIPTADIMKAITKAQKSLLGDAKISSSQITVRVSGPSQDDLDIVDLPGIIHNGPGSEETVQLIEKYIQSEQTLILVVSEAKQDDELVSALKLAAKHDQAGTRSLRILTKFDTFDSDDAQKKAAKLVADRVDDPLGPHAVVCRALGGSSYDSESEAETFCDMPSKHTDIASLKERLQPLYIELIRTNLPTLENNARVAKKAAEASLHKLGELPLSPVAMIREAQRALKLPQHSFTATITPAIDRAREAVHATSERIAPDFVSRLLKHDAFICPFFQGEVAFNAGMGEIVEWWRHPTERFIKEIAVALETSMSPINEDAVGVSERLRAAIKMQWEAYSADLVKSLRTQLQSTLMEEKDFGTVNHYIQQRYVEEHLMPDALIERAVESICGDNDSNKFCTDAATVRKQLQATRDAAVDKAQHATIGEYVASKVLCALKANWAVEKKTFTDEMLKKTRGCVVAKREEFIDLMVANDTLRSDALEDGDIGERRESLKATIAAMQDVIFEVTTLTVNTKRQPIDM